MARSAGQGETGRWRRRKEARPQEILDAALELFVRQGFAATRMEDVARAAGIRPGTVYVYYANKEALLKAVVDASVTPVITFAEARLREHEGSAAELLRELLLGWWREFGDTPHAGIARLIVAEAAQFPDLARLFVDEVMQRARRICADVLRRGVESGEFRPMDPERTAPVLMAPLNWLAIHAFSLRPYDPGLQDVESFLATHLDVVLHGLLAADSPPARRA